MKCTILGCGASPGTPVIACNCFVCSSGLDKNTRSRASILVEASNTKILVDVATDFRSQALTNNINTIDAILFTHGHADHFAGIDDLKPIVHQQKKVIPSYMNKETWQIVNSGFGYAFNPEAGSIYSSLMTSNIIEDYSQMNIGDIEVKSFLQGHGSGKSLGFRFGDLAYSTDVNAFPEESFQALQGVKIWIVDCLRYTHSPSHAMYEETLDWIDLIEPELAILTHMGHEIDYAELKRTLPKNIVPAYDGMVINF